MGVLRQRSVAPFGGGRSRYTHRHGKYCQGDESVNDSRAKQEAKNRSGDKADILQTHPSPLTH